MRKTVVALFVLVAVIFPQFVVPAEGVVVADSPVLSTSIELAGKLRLLKLPVNVGCELKFVANVRVEGVPFSL